MSEYGKNHGGINTDTLYFTDRCRKSLSAVMEKQIVIVEAPMGYGKTVAVREYLKDKPVNVIWVPLAAGGSTDRWEFFCDAIEENVGETGGIIWHLKTMGLPKSEWEVRETVKCLKQIPFRKPTILVIDDYQIVNDGETGNLVEAVARSGWKDLHVILITRDTFCGNSEVLRLKGQLSVIGRECFILSREDIKQYYESCGLFLTDDEASQLYGSTEGWITALYLYLLRYERDQVIALPANIYELIDLELFSGMPERLQNFLYAICPFKDFTYEQAEYVWERQGGEDTSELLRCLRNKNTFMLYGEYTRRFYIHSIFRQFLEKRVERQAEKVKNTIYTNCGDWFTKCGDYAASLEFYRKAKNHTLIMEIIRKDRGSAITLDNWAAYCTILDEFPEEVVSSYPDVVLILLLSAYLQNDIKYYKKFKQFTEHWIDMHEEGSKYYQLINNSYEIIKGMENYNDIDQMMSHFMKVGNGCTMLYEPGGPTWTMGCPSVMMMFYGNAGMLDEEVEKVVKNVPIYSSITDGHGAGGGELMRAEVLFNRGEFEGAKEAAHEAETIAENYGQNANVCIAKLMLMRCAFVAGDREHVGRLKAEIIELMESKQHRSRMLWRTAELGQGLIGSTVGLFSYVPVWMKSRETMRQHVYMFSYPIHMIVYGNCLLADGEYSKIIGMFQALLKDPIYYRHILFTIYANIYIAAGQYALGRESQALGTLLEVLDISIVDRVYMPFAENRRRLAGLYEAIQNHNPYRDIIGIINELADRLEAGIHNVCEGDNDGAVKSLLTNREWEIARLAYQGMTNKAIAEELYIAPSTVKRAMVVIFKKLGIHGRAELARIGQEFHE